MVCNDCSLVFDVIDANIEREWEEGMYDRPGNWIEYKTCPCCHSVEIERWYPWDAVFKAGG